MKIARCQGESDPIKLLAIGYADEPMGTVILFTVKKSG